jgi:large subunit ribosomal protein L9
MKVILKNDLETLGKTGDVVDVKRGYARNFLIPKGKAIEATNSNLKIFKEENKRNEVKSYRDKKDAVELADRLSKISVTAAVQVGEEDKVFGSVTSQNIADLLKENGFEIDRRKIVLDEPLKALGVYDIPIKLHTEVEAKIKLWIVRQ